MVAPIDFVTVERAVVGVHAVHCRCDDCQPSASRYLGRDTDPVIPDALLWAQIRGAESAASGITAMDFASSLRRIELLERAACLRRYLVNRSAVEPVARSCVAQMPLKEKAA
jgi:hypothetical protein